MRVLVTGGTGTLGRRVVESLGAHESVTVRVLSRRPAAPGAAGGAARGTEWAVGDFTTGAGLADALRGVDVVVHAAHDAKKPERDAAGVRALVDASTAAGVGRLVYVSIVGAREVPGIAYYRGKVAAEALALASPAGAVFRATQFFEFVAGMLRGFDRVPGVLPVPRGLRFQPVDVGEAGAALARFAVAGGGREAEIAGPEVLELRAMAEAWLAALGHRKRVLALPVPGSAVRAIAAGALTSATAERGAVTWHDWLAAGRRARASLVIE